MVFIWLPTANSSPLSLQYLGVLGLRMSSSRQSKPERRYPIYLSIAVGKAKKKPLEEDRVHFGGRSLVP
jgi:hypothetical protein